VLLHKDKKECITTLRRILHPTTRVTYDTTGRSQGEIPENNDIRLRLAISLAVCARSMYLHAAPE